MPCDALTRRPIRIGTDIKNIKKLEAVLKAMGFADIRTGKNLSYNAGAGSRSDAVLVVPGGQTIKVDGGSAYLEMDLAFVPGDDGTLELICNPYTDENITTAIVQEYARLTIKEIARAKGGKLMGDKRLSDGTYEVRILDPITGRTIYSKIMRDGKLESWGTGGAKTVCSAISQAIKQELMGVKPHKHDAQGNHIKVGGGR